MSLNNAPLGLADEREISWSAVFAGAVVALAVSIVLTILATGFGFNFAFAGLPSKSSLATFSPLFGAGSIAVQVLAAGFGGYVAGRLRPHWAYSHADEAHFRDTAHGLLAWAVSTLAGLVLAVTLLTSYADQFITPTDTPLIITADAAQRAANIAMQAAFFTAFGMILSAFIAAVAARVGGLRNEQMHLRAGERVA